MSAGRPLRMLTFAPMINSECGRLVLSHHRVDYEERDRLLGLASIRAWMRGGNGAMPFVYGRGLRLSSIIPLVEHFDREQPDRHLRPPVQPRRQRIDADWKRFNGELGSNVAVIAYYYLLPMRREMKQVFAAPLPWYERLLLPLFYTLLDLVFTALLRLKPPRVADSVMRVRLILDQVDSRLADGRRWLGGSERTLADLALVSALAPLVVPAPYAAQMPPEDVLPADYRALIAETRARPCAALVDRLYLELAA